MVCNTSTPSNIFFLSKNSFSIVKTTGKLCLRATGEKLHGHLIKIRNITHMKVVRAVNLLLQIQYLSVAAPFLTMSRLYSFSHPQHMKREFLALKSTSVYLEHVGSQQWFRAGEGWVHSSARHDDLGQKYFNSLWLGLVLKLCLWQAESNNSFSVVEKNLISNLNRSSSTEDNYSEQMHSTDNSARPGIE